MKYLTSLSFPLFLKDLRRSSLEAAVVTGIFSLSFNLELWWTNKNSTKIKKVEAKWQKTTLVQRLSQGQKWEFKSRWVVPNNTRSFSYVKVLRQDRQSEGDRHIQTNERETILCKRKITIFIHPTSLSKTTYTRLL